MGSAEKILLVWICEPRRQEFQRFLAGCFEKLSKFAERICIVVEEISESLVIKFDRFISQEGVVREFWLRFIVLRSVDRCHIASGFDLDFETCCIRARFTAALVLWKADIAKYRVERTVMM